VVAVHIRLSSVLFGILIPDLALTCVAAAAERQPGLLLFAPFYPVMRLVDAAIGLSAIPVAWLTRRERALAQPGTARGLARHRSRAAEHPGPHRPKRDRPRSRRLVHLQEKVLMHRDDDFGLATGQSLTMSPTRLMLVDDHLMITEALASRLSAAMDLWVAGRCNHSRSQLDRHRPRGTPGRHRDRGRAVRP